MNLRIRNARTLCREGERGLLRGDSGDMSGGEGGAAGRFVPADAPIAVGKIELVTGSATSCGQRGFVHLKVDDPVFRGDVIETSADGRVCIRFLDDTTFELSNSARMVLKEFPAEELSVGRPCSMLRRGDFAFIPGESGKGRPSRNRYAFCKYPRPHARRRDWHAVACLIVVRCHGASGGPTSETRV